MKKMNFSLFFNCLILSFFGNLISHNDSKTQKNDEFCPILANYIENASSDFAAIKGSKDPAQTMPDAYTAFELKAAALPPFQKGYIFDTKGNDANICIVLHTFFKTKGEMRGKYEALCSKIEDCLPSKQWNSLRKSNTATYQQNTIENNADFVTIQINPQTNIGMTDKYWLELRIWRTKAKI